MGLMSWLRGGGEPTGAMGFEQAVPSAPGSDLLITPAFSDMLEGLEDSTPLGRLYQFQWAVQVCADFLGFAVAHTKLKSYHRTADSPDELRAGEHPLPTLLERPNDQTTGFDLMLGTMSDLAVYDEAYWWKVFEGKAKALYRIPPAYVTPTGGSMISGANKYLIQIGRGPIEVDPSEMVHFHGYNPNDTRIGSSRLRALRAVLFEEITASKSRRAFFRNGGQQPGWLERPLEAPPLTDVGRTRLRTDLQNNLGGVENAGKYGILEEGTKFKEGGFSPKEAEFIAGRDFALDAVATSYGIPLALLSRKNTATFASMREFHKMLYVDVLGPWNALMEKAIWLQLIPDMIGRDDNVFDYYVEFNIAEKLQGDFEQQADALRAHVQVPDTSVNASRRIQNLPAYGDPEDPDNPYNWPARPAAYNYGDPSSTQDAAAQDPVQLAQVALAMALQARDGTPVAHNGHEERTPEELESLLEER